MATSRSVKDIARALIQVAHDHRRVPHVLRDLKAIHEAFQRDSQLAVDLDETAVPLEKRQRALKKALEKTIDSLLLNALLALQSRELLSHLSEMRRAALKEAEQIANHREALVTSATDLTKKELSEITKKLETRFGGTVEVEHRVDQKLLSGIQITIGDWNIDNSTKGKLERLTHALYV